MKRDKLLKIHNLLRVNHEETENLNRAVTSKIELIIKNLPTVETPAPGGFTGEFY